MSREQRRATFVIFLLALSLPALKAQSDEDVPCPDLNEDCVRNHLITHSNCQVRTFRKIPNKVTISNIRFKVPFFNVSHVDQYVTITNLDKCSISGFRTQFQFVTDPFCHSNFINFELHANQTTRETRLQLDCENLKIESMRAFIVHTAGESDLYYVIKVFAEYVLARLSMIIRGLTGLDICRSTSTAWVTHPSLLSIGQDRASVKFLRDDPRQMFGAQSHVWTREIWSYYVTPLIRYWINNYLCDFECNICEQ